MREQTMMGAMRWMAVVAIVTGAAFGTCGCNSGAIDSSWKVKEPMPSGLGRLVLDARRDRDRKAFNYGYVLYPIGIGASDPGFSVLTEPNVTKDYDPTTGLPPKGIPPIFYLKPGHYGIDIFGMGACFRGTDIVIREGEENVYRASMDPGGSVGGIVLGPATGTPLPGVIVWRPLDRGYGTDGKDWDPKHSYEGSRICKTTADGRYFIPDLPPGENTIVYYA
ncbi:MAG: hypothetical protein K8T20_00365, partial [Planctomycetes bacterium]|nr:hypothetical protein [Planctomycetota bacterium]